MNIIDAQDDDTLMGFIHEDVKWVTNGNWLARLEYVLLSDDLRERFKAAAPWRWIDEVGFTGFKSVTKAIEYLKVPEDAVRFLHTGISIDAHGVGPLVPLVSEDLTCLLLAQRKWVDVFDQRVRKYKIMARKGPATSGTAIWFVADGAVHGLVMPVAETASFKKSEELAKLAQALALMGIRPAEKTP